MLKTFEEALEKKVSEWTEEDLFKITSDRELCEKIAGLDGLGEFISLVETENPEFAYNYLRPAYVVIKAEKTEAELNAILDGIETEEELPPLVEAATKVVEEATDPMTFCVGFLTLLNYDADDEKVSKYGEKFKEYGKEVLKECVGNINQHNFLIASGGSEYLTRIDQIFCDRFGEILLDEYREDLSKLEIDVENMVAEMVEANIAAMDQAQSEESEETE